jgi:GNAT superfamily N-acetyltransferase
VMEFVISSRPVAPRAAILLGTITSLHISDRSVFVATDPTSGAILGAAVWGLPGHWRVPTTAYVRHARKLLKAVGLRGITKISVLSAIERQHPTEPHHYLAIIGTDPEHQGKGIGAALLAPVLDLCDEEGLPAYLESSKDSNVPYYRRFAFDVTTPFTLKGGPTLHFMWRDPEVPLT